MKRPEKAEPNFISSASALSIERTLSMCFLLIFAASISIKALDPDKRLTQYGHTTWRVLDGYLTSPSAIGQTTDGYIWIGTRGGLLRFDGVKFTPWTPPEGQALSSTNITTLLGTSDGSLWIGTSGGLDQLKDGQITNYPSKPGTGGIGSIIEDETKAVWFTRYRISDKKGPLCTVRDKEFRCFGKEDGVPVGYGQGLAKDAAGNFWIGSERLCRWTPQSSELFFEEELKQFAGDGVIAVAVNPAGQVWAALDATGPKQGVRYYSDGKWTSYTVPGFDGGAVRANDLYIDRHDSLWVGSATGGLYRIHNGIADNYAMKNGLSGNDVEYIFEDREGNLWVQTENGVDMFRDTPVLNFSPGEGLSATNISSIMGLSNGSVWVANGDAVDIIQPGAGIPMISTLKGLPYQHAGSMFEGSDGRVWLSVDGRIMKYEKDQFSEVKKPDGSSAGKIGNILAMTEDTNGNIWVGAIKNNERLLLRISDQILVDEILLDKTLRPESLAADRQGAIWFGSRRDKLARYLNGQTEIVSLGDANEIAIYNLMVDSDDALWASTNKGIYRWKNGALSLLNERNGLPCSTVFATLEDDSGSFWLYASCGLLRIPAADMANWRAFPESKVSVKIFDALDGALPSSGTVTCQRAAKSTDGRLWFLTDKAVQMINPRRSYSNPIPPPVYIEGLVADHKNYPADGQLNLPPLQNELEINFTALSYSLPRKINFRYKLEGADENWQDVGTRRQAFYNNLGPGNYHFRVIAANSDGVWNETGATLDFTVEPAWYQTTAFRVLCLLLAGLIAWILYRLRIRQISGILSARFDERLAERTRLARELHDTFLQTVQGSKLVADDALEQSEDPIHMRRALTQLSAWLGQATNEGRAALNSLRATTTEMNDLAEAFRRATEGCRLRESATVAFSVVGEARDMHPIVRDEIYRIGYEAIRNACQHSEATHLEVELTYARDLIFRAKDNGIGLDNTVAAAGKKGHFGLQGMRERADRIGAKLTIVSSATSGTEIILVVPGGIIFTETPRSTSAEDGKKSSDHLRHLRS